MAVRIIKYNEILASGRSSQKGNDKESKSRDKCFFVSPGGRSMHMPLLTEGKPFQEIEVN